MNKRELTFVIKLNVPDTITKSEIRDAIESILMKEFSMEDFPYTEIEMVETT